MHRYLATLALAYACAAHAETYPPIRAIAFEGNKVTREVVMRRELLVREGDPADPKLIERSRQAVLDLGLFRKVEVRRDALDGGVKLTFTVKEKWYILPVPRLEVNSDRELTYGMSLRWNNFLGRNHTVEALWTRETNTVEENRGNITSYDFSYNAPFVFDSPYTFTISGGHESSPVTDDSAPDPKRFTENKGNVRTIVTRSITPGPASQGWRVGGGFFRQQQSTSGAMARPGYGAATAAVALASYRDLRFKVFSEEGTLFSTEYQGAARGVASDFHYQQWTARYSRFYALGRTPHQQLNFLADLGVHTGGPPGEDAFSAGGSLNLRGFPTDFREGDLAYSLAVEYLRPIHYNWLRLLVVAEAGNAFEKPRDLNFNRVLTSLGVGLRIRLPFLVNVELEAGFALPIFTSTHPRFFAARDVR